MRLRHVIALAAAVVPALASDRAAGFEAAMMFDVYRMDGLRPEGDRTIATGCKGAKGGRCNFIEFISHIDSVSRSITGPDGKRQTVSTLNPASVPSNFDVDNPDITTTSRMMDWKGWPNPQYGKNPKVTEPLFDSYAGQYDQKRLLGGLFNAGKERDKHGDVLTKLGDVIQAGRTAGGSKADDLVKRLNTAFDNIVLARLADNAESLVRDLDLKAIKKYNEGKNAANPKIEIPTMDKEEPVTKQTYKVIDSDKMALDIKNHPSLSADAKIAIDNSITEYVTNYTNKKELSEKANSSGVTHHRDIEAAQAVQSRVKTILPSGCS